MNNTAKMFGYQILPNNEILFKRISRSRHFLKTPPAIAIDEEIFNEAIEEGIGYVQIFEREERVYYSATVEKFKGKAILIDRRFGRQLALPLNYWVTSKNKDIPRELMIERKPKVENNQQLSLFGRCK